MIFRQVLQTVVTEITSKSNTGEDSDVPVTHAFTSAVGARVAVDILLNEIHDPITNFRFGVHMLQSSEYRNDLITTLKIERDQIDPLSIQSSLL